MSTLDEIKKQNCFEGLNGKQLYVFGAGGIRGRKFFGFYGYEYHFEAVLDNNPQKWGKEYFGVPIRTPEILRGMNSDNYRVIIVTRDPAEVWDQVIELGARDIAVYDWERIYPGRQGICAKGEKPYHIGYVAGVFDLYHIGHLNLFRRAKEQCDYLIVGVTSDEYIRNNKGKEPVIPFEERIQMVASCVYVDEAVPIPYEFGGTVDAYQKYHFDVQFSGSDYTDNDWWLEQQRWLRQQGADLVFFPYTQQTSSTKIRKILDGQTVSAPLPEAENPREETVIYYPTIMHPGDEELLVCFAEIRRQCDRLLIAIPNDVIMARIYGDGNYTSANEIKKILDRQSFIDETIILDSDMLCRREMFKRLHFTKCVYGGEYGAEYMKDREFFDLLGVETELRIPETYSGDNAVDSLKIALMDVKRHQKIILFGTGQYFDCYMRRYGKKYQPAYAIDNDVTKWNTIKNGVKIQSPAALAQEHVDGCLIILCGKAYREMLIQVQSYGNFNFRALRYDNRITLLDEFGVAVRNEKKTVKTIQEILLKMTAELDRVCQKYNLRYYAICGTLIGALRHHDIIPWDDDLDVAMPREDFNKLREVVKNEWKDSEYELLMFDEYGGGAFLDFMPRIIYKNARQPIKVFDKVLGKATADIEDRLFIDIYLMDNACDNIQQHMKTMNIMKKVYALCMGHRAFVDFEEYAERNTESFMRQLRWAVRVGHMIPVKFLIWLYDKLSRQYNKKQTSDYFMPSCAITCIERRFDKNFFGEGVRVPFRDIEIMIPDDADGLLEAMGYHGYMTPLPESLRRPSHYFNSDIVIW